MFDFQWLILVGPLLWAAALPWICGFKTGQGLTCAGGEEEGIQILHKNHVSKKSFQSGRRCHNLSAKTNNVSVRFHVRSYSLARLKKLPAEPVVWKYIDLISKGIVNMLKLYLASVSLLIHICTYNTS